MYIFRIIKHSVVVVVIWVINSKKFVYLFTITMRISSLMYFYVQLLNKDHTCNFNDIMKFMYYKNFAPYMF